MAQEEKEIYRKEREEARKKSNQEYLDRKNAGNKTTKELFCELHDKLVQCCIDFIMSNNLTDLERVDFTADCLQESSKYGKWMPCTDSSLCGSELVEKGGWLISEEFIENM